MSGEPVVIQLSWEDPVTGQSHRSSLQAPIAIGRESARMPEQLGNQPVSHLELVHKQVSRWHALVTVVNRQLHITDKSANGTFLNGRPIRQDGQIFTPKDTLRIGPFKITAAVVNDGEADATELNQDRSHLAKPGTGANPNTILVWLVGGGILLLMGLGLWAAARALLDQARPQVEPPSPESSIENFGAEVGPLEILTTTT
ncbi:MAG: FHA domain-containing protein [Leptolyngbya sp. SIO1E4]|nr:FHA domain-containing protein [Leptolyngbya sp. SIO1E4]